MTREQIEKAANIEMLSHYADEEYPWGIKDIQSDFIESFIKGAQWRINSVWHDTCDIAEPGNDCLVEYMDGDGNVCIRIDRRSEYEWINACHYDKILRWAYISDLIPERKEETE